MAWIEHDAKLYNLDKVRIIEKPETRNKEIHLDFGKTVPAILTFLTQEDRDIFFGKINVGFLLARYPWGKE